MILYLNCFFSRQNLRQKNLVVARTWKSKRFVGVLPVTLNNFPTYIVMIQIFEKLTQTDISSLFLKSFALLLFTMNLFTFFAVFRTIKRLE